MVRQVIVVAALVTALAPRAHAQTAQVSGRVTNVAGSATFQRGVDTRPLVAGQEIYEGDVVRTSANATARLLMRDKGVLDLGPGSVLAIKTYRVEPQRRSRFASLSLVVGRVWAKVTKAVGNDSNFEVTTTQAVAGVRGTEFVVNVDESGATEVTVVAGAVAVSAGEGEATTLGAMQRGTVSQEGGSSVAVQEVTTEEIEQLENSVRPDAGDGDDLANDIGAPAAENGEQQEGAPAQDDGASEEGPPADEGPPAELPPVELDPADGQGRVRGRVEVRD